MLAHEDVGDPRSIVLFAFGVIFVAPMTISPFVFVMNPSPYRVVPAPEMNAPFVYTLDAEPMLPATKRSLPSSWKAVFVMLDVGEPRTMLVDLTNAPK